MNLSLKEKIDTLPIWQVVLILSVPSVITMMITNIYNLVDTSFVGSLGTSASGAVGVVFGLMAILQAIGFTFGQGAGSILSRKLGQGDKEGATMIASSGFAGAFICSTVVSIVCFIIINPLVYMLGSTDTIAPFAKIYISYVLATAPFMVTGFTMNNLLRYEGKSFLGMIGLMAGAILNIAGDMIFMFGMHMGIAGAGLSTAISQTVSFFILLSAFLRGKTECRLSLKSISRDVLVYADIITTGFSSLIRQGLSSVTTIMLNTVAAGYGGDAAVAAMSIVSRLFFFMFSIAVGVGQGFQPVCGFTYGAKDYKKLKKGYWFTMLMAELLMLVVGFFVYLKAPQLIAWLRDDVEVVNIGTRALRLQCLAAILMPMCMVTEMLMQASGQRLNAIILATLRNGLIFIVCLHILSKLRGLSGVQEAQPLSFIISVLPAVIMAHYFWKKLPIIKLENETPREKI